MKHYESLIIGHVSMDRNIDHLDQEVTLPGGAVLYSCAAAHALGHKVAALTKLAPQDREWLAAFTLPQADVICLDSAASTHIHNKYFTPDKERRTCKCFSKGDEIAFEDFPDDLSAEVYQFAGLFYGDFSAETVKKTTQKGKVAVDSQSFLRHRNREDQSVFFEDWAEKKEILPYVDFLKADAAEAEILTGFTDRTAAAKQLYAWGAKEILITHYTEVLAYAGDEIFICPIRSRNLSGRTGRGDTTFGAYLCERLTHGIRDALLAATATVSLKMEKPGILKAERADIEAYIKAFYGDYLPKE